MKTAPETPHTAELDEAGEAEAQLCISCIEPNAPDAHFCSKCKAPLSSYAATAPFERIFAEGHCYRAAVENPQSPLVLAGILAIFGSTALGSAIMLTIRRDAGALQLLFSGFVLLVSVAIIWRTSRSYHRLRRARASAPVESDKD